MQADVRNPRLPADATLRQRVMAEVESAGPPLCTVNLTHGMKENKVLLPATTFERLVDTVQFSCVPDRKRGRGGSLNKTYQVVGKPQDVQQIARRFPFPAACAGAREGNPVPDKKPQPTQGRKPPKDSAGLTEADFLAIRQPKGPTKEEIQAKKAQEAGKRSEPHYCARHRPHPDILPSKVREAVGFPAQELLLSSKLLLMARSGDTHVKKLDPGPDLAQALPIIGLYDHNNRVPLQCGWPTLELSDKAAANGSSPSLDSPGNGRRTSSSTPADGSPRPEHAAAHLGFFLTASQKVDLQGNKANESTPSPGVRLPAIGDRHVVVTPLPSEDGGMPSEHSSREEESGSTSLFTNDFQGMRAIIQALDEICPPLALESSKRKKRTHPSGESGGHESPGSEDEDYESDDPEARSHHPNRGSPSAREDGNGIHHQEGKPNDANCVVCRKKAETQVVRRKADVEHIMAHPTNVDTMVGDWKGMFVNCKLKCNSDLLQALEHRQQTRNAVYQSPVHLGRITQKAIDDACQWSLSRSFAQDKHNKHENPNDYTLWADAGQMLRDEREHARASILFYMRLAIFLDALRSPTQDSQVAVVAGVRQYLIDGGQVHRQLLFRMLAQAGPTALESREIMKVVHFVRVELKVPLERLIQWIRAKPRRQMGWKLTSDLVALWDKIRTGSESKAAQSPHSLSGFGH